MKAKPLALAVPFLAMLLGGCARVNDMAANFLASDTTAHAVIGEQLLSGRALLHADRSGSLDLSTPGNADLNCMGSMRYTASTGGMVNLRCSNGTQAQFPFTALSETSGHASSHGGPQPGISLVYGLSPEQARAWLSPPAGRRLVVSGEGLRLE